MTNPWDDIEAFCRAMYTLNKKRLERIQKRKLAAQDNPITKARKSCTKKDYWPTRREEERQLEEYRRALEEEERQAEEYRRTLEEEERQAEEYRRTLEEEEGEKN